MQIGKLQSMGFFHYNYNKNIKLKKVYFYSICLKLKVF